LSVMFEMAEAVRAKVGSGEYATEVAECE